MLACMIAGFLLANAPRQYLTAPPRRLLRLLLCKESGRPVAPKAAAAIALGPPTPPTPN